MIEPQRIDEDGLAALAALMRRTDQRLADLRAQRAANLLGRRRVEEMAARIGVGALTAGMAAVLDYAERRSRAAIAALEDGDYAAVDWLEAVDGSEIPLRVRVEIRGETMNVDFSGSRTPGRREPELPDSRDARRDAVRDPRADRPRRTGLRRCVPAGGDLRPTRVRSQRAAGGGGRRGQRRDLQPGRRPRLRGARRGRRRPRAGTGDDEQPDAVGRDGSGELTYYETIGGGQGACRDAPGPSGVHVAMSNTLNTPIEALEPELPVRVRELSIRRGSGGDGRMPGGDGVVRRIEALAPLRYSLITERRDRGPRGRETEAATEVPGATPSTALSLPAKCEGELAPGDVLSIETPGGGGFGAAGGGEPKPNE